VDDTGLNTLLDNLSSFEFPKEQTQLTPKAHNTPQLEQHEVNQFVIDKTKKLVETGVDAVQDMMPYVQQGQNPDEIAALAELMNATTKAIEAMNKANLIEKKADRDERMKKIELEAKKELIQLKPGNTVNNNTNVLIASREEIMKRLVDVKDSKVLEINDK
jgi:hypothetical protein